MNLHNNKTLASLDKFWTKYCSQTHNLFFHEFIAPNSYNTSPLWLSSSVNTQNSVVVQKSPCKKLLYMQKRECLIMPLHPYKFPLFLLLAWLTLFPKLIVLNPHALNNYGMWLLTPTLLHEFNNWLWEHSTTNRRLYNMIIILGMWVGLISMNNSSLDPLSLVESYSPHHFHPSRIAANDYYSF